MRFLAIFLAIVYIYIPHFVFAESIVASQSITSDWGIGFCGNISLKNTGTTEASWSELTFVLSNATVTSLWGGNVSHTGDAYTVKSLSWNQKIAPGSSTDVGYCGQGSGRPTSLNLTASTISTPTPPPSSVERPSVVTLNTNGLSLVASVTGDWNSGYCRNVVLKNTGTTPITNWNISFDMIGDINIWSATKVKNGNTITVTPASWNAKLGQAEWGFCTTGSQVDQNWQIAGVETGVAPPLPDSINGICGSDNNATLSSTPTNLCISGTSSVPSGTGPWSWTCQGLNSGTSMSCQASKGTVTPPLHHLLR